MEKFVHIENVEMTFTTKKGPFQALTGVNLTVNQGEFVTFIGHSGCGKSTLLNQIAGLLKPTHGRIFVAGRVDDHRPDGGNENHPDGRRVRRLEYQQADGQPG